jgi:hypothetical protein
VVADLATDFLGLLVFFGDFLFLRGMIASWC